MAVSISKYVHLRIELANDARFPDILAAKQISM